MSEKASQTEALPLTPVSESDCVEIPSLNVSEKASQTEPLPTPVSEVECVEIPPLWMNVSDTADLCLCMIEHQPCQDCQPLIVTRSL